MYERYTERAKRAIFFALLEARHRNELTLCPCDILLGLTWDCESRAERIAFLKSRAVALRASVGVPHLPITSTPYLQEKRIPLDNDCKKILAYAAMEANRDGEYWLDSDHLLRGLLRVASDAQKAVNQSGIFLDSLRTASRSDRLKNPPETVTPVAKVKMFMLRDLGSWPLAFLAVFAFGLIAAIEWWFAPLR